MSDNPGTGAAGNSDFGREQRRATQAEGRRPVESRDRAPEVYVEGEQVARLVETRRAESLPDVPQASWFDDDVPPSAAPAMVAVMDRPVDGVATQAAETAPADGPSRGPFAPARDSDDDRLVDEFDVMVRGLDDPGSTMNTAFPRLGKQSDTDMFDPLAFEFPPAGDAPEGTMRPAVEPPMPGQGRVDLSGEEKAAPDFGAPPPTTGFGEPPEDSVMRPAVEPRTGDTTVDLSGDESNESTTKADEPTTREDAVGTRPPAEISSEKSAPVAEETPTRLPDLPGVSRGDDVAIPSRPDAEDLVTRGRRELAEDDAATSKAAPSEGGREPVPVARDTGRTAADESLDVFDTRPAAGLPARADEAAVPSRVPATEVDRRETALDVPKVSLTGEEERAAGRGDAEFNAATTGVRPGSGFFDETPERQGARVDVPVATRELVRADTPAADETLPDDDSRDVPSRFELPDSARDELAPLKFEDDDNLDDG